METKVLIAATGFLAISGICSGQESLPVDLALESEDGIQAIEIETPIGTKGTGVACVTLDSSIPEDILVKGWQLSIGYSNAIDVTRVSLADEFLREYHDIGWKYFESHEYTPRVDPEAPLSLNLPPSPLYDLCEIEPGQPQGKGLVSAFLFFGEVYLPSDTGGPWRILKIEYEQAEPFVSEEDLPQIADLEWKNCLHSGGEPVVTMMLSVDEPFPPRGREGLRVIFKVKESPKFKRGDTDGNSQLEVTDIIRQLAFQFLGEAEPPCLDAIDFDDNGSLDITDSIANLTHQFLGGPPPPDPGKEACGKDPTPDSVKGGDLGCSSYPQSSCE